MSKSSHIHRVSNSLPMTTERAPRSNLFHKMQPNELNTFMGLYRFLYGPHRTLNQSIEIPRDNNDIIMFLLMSSPLHKGCLSQHSRVVFYLIRVSAPLSPPSHKFSWRSRPSPWHESTYSHYPSELLYGPWHRIRPCITKVIMCYNVRTDWM